MNIWDKPVALACRAAPWVALPYILFHLYQRGRRQEAYRHHLKERWGFYDSPPPAAGSIWIHCVSLGETRAVEPLIKLIRAHHPHRHILLTHMTPTGRAACPELNEKENITRLYLPYDFYGAVKRFLDHFRPCIGLLMETELWPNLIGLCHERKLPLLLINGRLSESSYRAYKFISPFTTYMLSRLWGIGARSQEDAAKFHALGASRVEVLGNVKFDTAVTPHAHANLIKYLAQLFSRRRVIFAASTHEKEEDALIRAHLAIEGNALLVIAPRHPQRFESVAALMNNMGLPPLRRSLMNLTLPPTPLPDAYRVMLADSLGEMSAFFASSDVVIMGGTFGNHGGHNFIEPCLARRAVILGPSTFNFSDTPEAIRCDAVLSVPNENSAVIEAYHLLNDEGKREQLAAQGFAFAHTRAGASRRVMKWIEPLLV